MHAWCANLTRYVAIASLTFLLAACMPASTISARGQLFGQPIESTVDAEVARYYLEQFLPGHKTDSAYKENIAALYARHGDRPDRLPTRDELRDIGQAYSVDFASLYFADRLLSNPCNQQLNLRFQQALNESSTFKLNAASYLVLFVPGWDYAENGHATGADFAQPRLLATRFGFENYLVALPPTGSVAENATVIAAEVARHSQSGKKLLLVGASSAGPAIHLALGERIGRKELTQIGAWLNLGGILQGSPLVDFLQETPQRWLFNLVVWFKDWDKDAIMSMAIEPSRARYARLRIAPEILVINYLGVPLSGQLSQYSRDKYPLLRSDGPNDGLTLLADALAPNSLTVVAMGSDHFFAEDPRINEKTIALMKLITTYLDDDLAQGCFSR